MRMAHQLQRGIEPPMLARPESFRAVPIEVITAEGDFGRLWSPYFADFLKESDAALAAWA